jgi:hypothetical protein
LEILILNRGRAGLVQTYAQGDNVRLQQEAVVKELRTDKTDPLEDAVIA